MQWQVWGFESRWTGSWADVLYHNTEVKSAGGFDSIFLGISFWEDTIAESKNTFQSVFNREALNMGLKIAWQLKYLVGKQEN